MPRYLVACSVKRIEELGISSVITATSQIVCAVAGVAYSLHSTIRSEFGFYLVNKLINFRRKSICNAQC